MKKSLAILGLATLLATTAASANAQSDADLDALSPRCAADHEACRRNLNALMGLLIENDARRESADRERAARSGSAEVSLCKGVMTQDGCQPKGSKAAAAPLSASKSPGSLNNAFAATARTTILENFDVKDCPSVTDVKLFSDGSMRAKCDNGETFRVAGKIAMRCSAVLALGVTGC
jgi:hypothetical protein